MKFISLAKKLTGFIIFAIAGGISINVKAALPALNTQADQYFQEPSNAGGTQTYTLGPRTIGTGGIGRNTLGGTNSYLYSNYLYSKITGATPFNTTANPLMNYSLNSQWVDEPNVNYLLGGKEYSSLFNDVKATGTTSLTNVMNATDGSNKGMLSGSTGLMINSDNLQPMSIGTTNFSATTKHNNNFFYPTYTNIKSITKTGSTIEAKFTSYYTRAEMVGINADIPDPSTGHSQAADSGKSLAVDVDLVISEQLNGSLKVMEKVTNDSSTDLTNTYIMRMSDTFIGNLAAATTETANSALVTADKYQGIYSDDNRGFHFDTFKAPSSDTTNPIRLNYSFDVPYAPNAWRAAYQKSTTFDANGFIQLDPTLFGGTKDPNDNGYNGGSGDSHEDSYAATDSTLSAPSGSGTISSDNGISMKWGPFSHWQPNQTKTLSYVVGMSQINAPVIHVPQVMSGTDSKIALISTGQTVTAQGYVNDKDGSTTDPTAEKIFYSVDGGSVKAGNTVVSSGMTGNSGGLRQLATITPTGGWTPGAHYVQIWATDASGYKSLNIETIRVVVKQAGTVPETSYGLPDTMYYSPAKGANTNPVSDNFDSNWAKVGDTSESGDFTIQLPKGTQYEEMNQASMSMIINANTNAWGLANSSTYDSTKTSFFNTQLWLFRQTDDNTLYKTTNSFKLGQDVFNTGGSKIGGTYVTDNKGKFIVLPPKLTIDQNKTQLYAGVGKGNQISGNNLILDSSGKPVETSVEGGAKQSTTQVGNKVYAFRDQGDKGQYDADDQAYDRVLTNAMKTVDGADTVVDSNGNFTLKLSDSEKVTPGETIWLIETNASGGTSAWQVTSKKLTGNTDGTGYPKDPNNPDKYGSVSGTGAVGVKATAEIGFLSNQNWDFGTENPYQGFAQSYPLQSATNTTGSTGTSSLEFKDGANTVNLSANLSPLTVAGDANSAINDASITLNNIKLTGDQDAQTNQGKATINTSSDSSNLSTIFNLSNPNQSSTWKVDFGSGGTGKNEDVQLNIPAGKKLTPDKEYQGTVTWTLANSV